MGKRDASILDTIVLRMLYIFFKLKIYRNVNLFLIFMCRKLTVLRTKLEISINYRFNHYINAKFYRCS